MEYHDLRVELEDGVATLTLDRPERMNAFSGAMGESLGRAYRECDARDDVHAVERLEPALHRHLMAGPDPAEGARAWLERRPARWAWSVGEPWPDALAPPPPLGSEAPVGGEE